jgi:hypothetical protein
MARSDADLGGRVSLVQEWLSLHDVQVAIDGKYGPPTGPFDNFRTGVGFVLGATRRIGRATKSAAACGM